MDRRRALIKKEINVDDTDRSSWWRCTEYEIKRGSIQPKPGARVIRTDPWRDFEECGQKSSFKDAVQPPYQALLNLAMQLSTTAKTTDRLCKPLDYPEVEDDMFSLFNQAKRDAPPDMDVDSILGDFLEEMEREVPENDRELILEFCCKHGLLGILMQQSIQISAPGESGDWCRAEIHYYRVGGFWVRAGEDERHPLEEETDEEETDEEDLEVFQPSPRSPVVVHLPFTGDILSPHVDTTEYSLIGRQFFPSPDCLGHWGAPKSEKFCQQYSEPFFDFVRFAHRFAQAVENRLEDPLVYWAAAAGQPLPNRPFAFASLLAAFATMALHDRVVGKRAVRCPGCAKAIIANGYQQKYCTPRCGWRHRKQKKRGLRT
jgi:hypothetical protein